MACLSVSTMAASQSIDFFCKFPLDNSVKKILFDATKQSSYTPERFATQN